MANGCLIDLMVAFDTPYRGFRNTDWWFKFSLLGRGGKHCLSHPSNQISDGGLVSPIPDKSTPVL